MPAENSCKYLTNFMMAKFTIQEFLLLKTFLTWIDTMFQIIVFLMDFLYVLEYWNHAVS